MPILNVKNIDYTRQPMFFGEPLGLQRYERFKYPAFDVLTAKQMSFFWQPQEIGLAMDRVNYAKMTAVQRHIFTSNLRYQTLLDSVQGRGPITALLPCISLPELEECIVWWDAFEIIHSRTYSYLIKNVYANSAEILDQTLEIPEILARAASVTRHYDALIDMLPAYQQHGFVNAQHEYDLKAALYLALIAINILEGVRFYVSFACTFAFGELKLMEGTAKLIGMIARDENLHLSITQHMINLVREREQDAVFAQVMRDHEATAIGMFKDAVDQECAWAEYLFQGGSMIGLNARLLSDYVQWIANRRMQAIGLPRQWPWAVSEAANPLPWTKNYLSSRSEQVAPQESEITQYLISSLNKNTELDLGGFEL